MDVVVSSLRLNDQNEIALLLASQRERHDLELLILIEVVGIMKLQQTNLSIRPLEEIKACSNICIDTFETRSRIYPGAMLIELFRLSGTWCSSAEFYNFVSLEKINIPKKYYAPKQEK